MQAATGASLPYKLPRSVLVIIHTADLQVLPADAHLPPLPTVGLRVQLDLPRPSELVTAFAAHLQRVVPRL